MQIQHLLEKHAAAIVEGSMYDLLHRGAGDLFDPTLGHLGLLYSDRGVEILRDTYCRYIEAAHAYQFPILLFTPTWRANQERMEASPLGKKNFNHDAAQFLSRLKRDAVERTGATVLIGGLLGCKNDCYRPQEALSAPEAALFHKPQVQALGNTDVDFVFASTLPSSEEALGIAIAASATGKPYILSFVLDSHGALLDGISLVEAMRKIDSRAPVMPLGYFVNCVHPEAVRVGLTKNPDHIDFIHQRLLGVQGNTSKVEAAKLDTLTGLQTEDPTTFAKETLSLREALGVRCFGGCCGTSPEHISEIARLLSLQRLDTAE